MKGPIKRRVPGLHYSYIDKEGFIVYWYGFDSLVAVFHNIILAYLSNSDNEIIININYLSEFYAWAYWCDTGSTKLPQRIEDKAKEAKLLLEKKVAEWRQKKEAEEARKQEYEKQVYTEFLNHYFYADDVESGKVPLDSDKMAACLAFREIVEDVKELALADYFRYERHEIVYRLSTQQPYIILLYTLVKAAGLKVNSKIGFTDVCDRDGHFELNREQCIHRTSSSICTEF